MLFAAVGYSLIYMLGGGGIVGAIVIFVIAKMLGRQWCKTTFRLLHRIAAHCIELHFVAKRGG
jgi:uncharacterized membrane protein YdjX (TVP38/TMEM64 family)